MNNFIKFNVILSFILQVVHCSLPEEDVSNWVKRFNCKHPRVIFLHTQQNVKMIINGTPMITAKNIQLDTKKFNGIPFTAPLILAVNMSQETFAQGLRNSGLID